MDNLTLIEGLEQKNGEMNINCDIVFPKILNHFGLSESNPTQFTRTFCARLVRNYYRNNHGVERYSIKGDKKKWATKILPKGAELFKFDQFLTDNSAEIKTLFEG